MKTGLKMIDDAYAVINVADVTNAINGKVYKLTRPKNSQKEDIVINALPITAEQFQQGVFNVNIHAPNLVVKIDGIEDDTQPNITRLKAITDIVIEKIKDVVGYDYTFYAEDGGYPIRDNDNTWFVNIRVAYHAVQLNYTNI